MRRLALLALVLLAPVAAAADLLPTETAWGPREARLVVRAVDGEVSVQAEPAIHVALAYDDAPATTPRVLRASAPWRGMTDVVELVLLRDDPAQGVDVVVEDAGATGVWFEWPPARESPAGVAPLAVGTLLALLCRRSRDGEGG